MHGAGVHGEAERELGEARGRAAQAMLLDSEVSLTAIAHDGGCGSPAHFSVLFRKVTGETPTQCATGAAGSFKRSDGSLLVAAAS